MERSWCESQSAVPRPAEPAAGILKPTPGLFDPPKAQPTKTLRFRSEPQHIEPPQTERASIGNNAELSDNSDASANSASSSSSSSNSDDTGGETQERSATQSRDRGGDGAAASGAADRMLSLPSWFSGHVKRYLAAFMTRAEPDGRGRDGSTSSSDRDRPASDSDAGVNRPSRRRRRRSAAERYNPPSQDDMRWRVALSRYALLTVLGVVALLFVFAAALHVTRGNAPRLVEQQPAAVTLDAGEDDGWPGRPALKTSARDDDVRPDHELTVEETGYDTVLTTTEGAPTTAEPPTSGGAEQMTVDLVSTRRAEGSSVPAP